MKAQLLDLPKWWEDFRPGQEAAIARIVAEFQTKKFVVFDAPTGIGKTLIAEMARQMMQTRAIYLCTSKTLQEQFAHDYPWSAVIKGRANYPTLEYPGEFPDLSADDCTLSSTDKRCLRCTGSPFGDDNRNPRRHCLFCHPSHMCPYRQAKNQAIANRLVCTNTSYFLREANGSRGNGKGELSGWPMVIVDEADRLEDELMSFIEIRIGRRRIEQFNLPIPERRTVPASWEAWRRTVLPILERELAKLPNSMDRRVIRTRGWLTNLIRRLNVVTLDEGFIYGGYDQGNIVFRPVMVAADTPQVLWRHSPRFLFMSATILSPDQFCNDLGVPRDELAYIRFPSTFAPSRRPVVIRPRADMGHKAKEWEKMTVACREILAAHPDERVLIHTVSYALAIHLHKLLDKRRTLIYSASSDRDKVLARFKKKRAAVLIAPSMERGIDLPDDLCRVVVVAKVPFPNLGDKQIAARLHSKGGDTWYKVTTVRALVQMTGRGMRSASDWCVSYVLDTHAVQLLRNSRHLFPAWWLAAVDMTGWIRSKEAMNGRGK